MTLRSGVTGSPRHRTAWVEAGPADGPLMIFVHGWPELGVVWRAQLEHFTRLGVRCVAPDMRGYGGSSAPADPSAYALREIVADMTEPHDALGGAPAVWVGHDWAARWRSRWPRTTRPVAGRWRASASRTRRGVSPRRTCCRWWTATGTRPTSTRTGSGATTAGTRGRSTAPPRTSRRTWRRPSRCCSGRATRRPWGARRGRRGWWRTAAGSARLTLPVLFLHAAWDTICDTRHSRLADPMRADCADLTEWPVGGGHERMLERPEQVNAALERWPATVHD